MMTLKVIKQNEITKKMQTKQRSKDWVLGTSMVRGLVDQKEAANEPGKEPPGWQKNAKRGSQIKKGFQKEME